jgi:Serine aminopeptidase, S33
MGRVRAPVLLMHAEDDAFVHNSAFDRFAAAAPHCHRVMYRGTYHEVGAFIIDLSSSSAVKRSTVRRSPPCRTATASCTGGRAMR